MKKIAKFPKANRVFVENKKVLEFIKYCKDNYSKDIRKIELILYEEDDANIDEWQLIVSECSENNKQGIVWAPWYIPSIVMKSEFTSSIYDKIVDTKYYEKIK